jgi:2'-5' RNA ligase
MKGLYLIALLPPADLSEQIDEIRRECSVKFDVYKALRPPVHITLYPPFRFEEDLEKQLKYILQQQTLGSSRFTQHLENFGHFRKEVVFIKALNSPELTSLKQAITAVFQKENTQDRSKTADFHPHITIAYRDVTPYKFQRIWNEYRNREFIAHFPAKQFTLLKHDNVRWNPVEDFALEGTG